MSWDDLRGRGITAGLSEHDGRRFGVRAARIVVRQDEDDPPAAAKGVLAHLGELDPDVAIVRWPASMSLGQPIAGSGRLVYPADTLVYWATSVDATSTRPESFVALDGRPDLVAQWPALVREVFVHYPNHYAASSQFRQDDVLEGYVEWATRATDRAPERCYAVLGPAGEVLALATTLVLRDGSLEVELAGTVPGHRRSGNYRSLMQGLMAVAAQDGAGRLVISTQAGNTAVQSAWASAGLRPFSAFTTVHVWPGAAGVG